MQRACILPVRLLCTFNVCTNAFRGFVTVLVSWEGLRNKVAISDLERQGYVYKLTRPWIPSDPPNGTGLVLAESSPGVGAGAGKRGKVWYIVGGGTRGRGRMSALGEGVHRVSLLRACGPRAKWPSNLSGGGDVMGMLDGRLGHTFHVHGNAQLRGIVRVTASHTDSEV